MPAEDVSKEPTYRIVGTFRGKAGDLPEYFRRLRERYGENYNLGDFTKSPDKSLLFVGISEEEAQEIIKEVRLQERLSEMLSTEKPRYG